MFIVKLLLIATLWDGDPGIYLPNPRIEQGPNVFTSGMVVPVSGTYALSTYTGFNWAPGTLVEFFGSVSMGHVYPAGTTIFMGETDPFGGSRAGMKLSLQSRVFAIGLSVSGGIVLPPTTTGNAWDNYIMCASVNGGMDFRFGWVGILLGGGYRVYESPSMSSDPILAGGGLTIGTKKFNVFIEASQVCLLYTSPSPRD